MMQLQIFMAPIVHASYYETIIFVVAVQCELLSHFQNKEYIMSDWMFDIIIGAW